MLMVMVMEVMVASVAVVESDDVDDDGGGIGGGGGAQFLCIFRANFVSVYFRSPPPFLCS